MIYAFSLLLNRFLSREFDVEGLVFSSKKAWDGNSMTSVAVAEVELLRRKQPDGRTERIIS